MPCMVKIECSVSSIVVYYILSPFSAKISGKNYQIVPDISAAEIGP